MQIKTTKYYEEFLYYFKLAEEQQRISNLGQTKHELSGIQDDLMCNIHLYDVIERKYAGFSQIINDIFYGWSDEHPYWQHMQSGNIFPQREQVAKAWTNKRNTLKLEDWLYLFILHRVTGSAINYATKPSGYHNTLLFVLHEADNIEHMCKIIKGYNKPFYTSVGYQFPAFPKPDASKYKRGGDYFLCEYAPKLARDLAKFLQSPGKKTLRQIGEFMFNWNKSQGLRAYKFQYAAVVADIADWFSDFVYTDSLFYYGTNAVECIGYLADPVNGKGKTNQDFLDTVMLQIFKDLGSLPYNAEDVACDFIRWIENYARPGKDYNHIDLDKTWNSSSILDHPFGRQKAMLEHGLIDTFNTLDHHPSDDKIITAANMTIAQYKNLVYKTHGA